jgi:hypothetical protein
VGGSAGDQALHGDGAHDWLTAGLFLVCGKLTGRNPEPPVLRGCSVALYMSAYQRLARIAREWMPSYRHRSVETQSPH